MTRRVWAVFWLALRKYFQIDGVQWAAAFAFNALFSLFPLLVLLVTIAPSFVNPDRAGREVIVYLRGYVPINDQLQSHVFSTIASVVKARHRAGVVAFLILVWSALQCFTTLISATTRAWGAEVHNWWRLPLKSLVLLGLTAGAGLLGMAAPVLMRMKKNWLFSLHELRSWVDGPGSLIIPVSVVFLGLSVFYWLAPRRSTRFAEVWIAALFATILLRAGESLFVIYLKNFARWNAVYGAFGGFMALLLWIYISGCVIVFGACLCAAQDEIHRRREKTPGRRAGNRGGGREA